MTATETATPADGTATPTLDVTPTPTEADITPTPTEADITPTPTEADITPTPTEADITPTPTEAVTPTPRRRPTRRYRRPTRRYRRPTRRYRRPTRRYRRPTRRYRRPTRLCPHQRHSRSPVGCSLSSGDSHRNLCAISMGRLAVRTRPAPSCATCFDKTPKLNTIDPHHLISAI
ncbi:hypothetical protein [Candidatus Amarolinea dominans]|uniref:hypothetical protein n=1 Tax=Candidatus Amarolinea dominans TaxID=3140696 RepID=UPI0031368BAF|nr:hypothetical protein [Anaerolineae bacterium]